MSPRSHTLSSCTLFPPPQRTPQYDNKQQAARREALAAGSGSASGSSGNMALYPGLDLEADDAAAVGAPATGAGGRSSRSQSPSLSVGGGGVSGRAASQVGLSCSSELDVSISVACDEDASAAQSAAAAGCDTPAGAATDAAAAAATPLQASRPPSAKEGAGSASSSAAGAKAASAAISAAAFTPFAPAAPASSSTGASAGSAVTVAGSAAHISGGSASSSGSGKAPQYSPLVMQSLSGGTTPGSQADSSSAVAGAGKKRARVPSTGPPASTVAPIVTAGPVTKRATIALPSPSNASIPAKAVLPVSVDVSGGEEDPLLPHALAAAVALLPSLLLPAGAGKAGAHPQPSMVAVGLPEGLTLPTSLSLSTPAPAVASQQPQSLPVWLMAYPSTTALLRAASDALSSGHLERVASEWGAKHDPVQQAAAAKARASSLRVAYGDASDGFHAGTHLRLVVPRAVRAAGAAFPASAAAPSLSSAPASAPVGSPRLAASSGASAFMPIAAADTPALVCIRPPTPLGISAHMVQYSGPSAAGAAAASAPARSSGVAVPASKAAAAGVSESEGLRSALAALRATPKATLTPGDVSVEHLDDSEALTVTVARSASLSLGAHGYARAKLPLAFSATAPVTLAVSLLPPATTALPSVDLFVGAAGRLLSRLVKRTTASVEAAAASAALTDSTCLRSRRMFEACVHAVRVLAGNSVLAPRANVSTWWSAHVTQRLMPLSASGMR